MKTIVRLSIVLLPLFVAACTDGSARETLGLNRDAPDEFTVVSRPPLTVPPEFNLRPPVPGEAPRGTATDEQARSLITGTTATTTPSATATTPGAESLLKRAGANSADDTIRSRLTTDVATPRRTKDAATLYDQLTGGDKDEPVVDPKAEAERLRANKDAGKPVTEGDVPEEKSKARSVLDRIF